VALGTGSVGVRASERERGLGSVIERRARPISGAVAQRAILREAGLHVVRIRSALIVLQVARGAGGGQTFEDAAGVALTTSCGGMFACQRERSLGGVIEHGSVPICGAVTELAILREARGNVIGVGGALEILEVT